MGAGAGGWGGDCGAAAHVGQGMRGCWLTPPPWHAMRAVYSHTAQHTHAAFQCPGLCREAQDRTKQGHNRGKIVLRIGE